MKVVQWRTSSRQRAATIGRLRKYCLLPTASECETSDRQSEYRRLNREQSWPTSGTAFPCHRTVFDSPAHSAAARITSGDCRPKVQPPTSGRSWASWVGCRPPPRRRRRVCSEPVSLHPGLPQNANRESCRVFPTRQCSTAANAPAKRVLQTRIRTSARKKPALIDDRIDVDRPNVINFSALENHVTTL